MIGFKIDLLEHDPYKYARISGKKGQLTKNYKNIPFEAFGQESR